FHAPATTAIYTLSLHDALPISEIGGLQRIEQRGIHGRRKLTGDRRGQARTQQVSRQRAEHKTAGEESMRLAVIPAEQLGTAKSQGVRPAGQRKVVGNLGAPGDGEVWQEDV